MFINANLPADGPIWKAGVKTYDQSSFFRIGSIADSSPSESGAVQAAAGFVFRAAGYGSVELKGAGPLVWRRRSRRRQSLRALSRNNRCGFNGRRAGVEMSLPTTGINGWVTLLVPGNDGRKTLSEDKVSHPTAPVVNKAWPMCCDWPARKSARATSFETESVMVIS